MPELPEVETTCRSIRPYLQQQSIRRIVVRQPKLRWPVPDNLNQLVAGKEVLALRRRAKYMLFDVDGGSLISHLGMSGSWRLLQQNQPATKHEHLDIELGSGQLLRYTDPRRFGCFLWSTQPLQHPLLVKLGPEPLSDDFNAQYLYDRAQKRKTAIKLLLMNNHIVVGVGNIYANEALFTAGIDPRRAAGAIDFTEYQRLVIEIKQILRQAINQGGTTLRDFVSGDGRPGYFQQELLVYGRAGLACNVCANTLQGIRQGQRASVFCPHCQT